MTAIRPAPKSHSRARTNQRIEIWRHEVSTCIQASRAPYQAPDPDSDPDPALISDPASGLRSGAPKGLPGSHFLLGKLRSLSLKGSLGSGQGSGGFEKTNMYEGQLLNAPPGGAGADDVLRGNVFGGEKADDVDADVDVDVDVDVDAESVLVASGDASWSLSRSGSGNGASAKGKGLMARKERLERAARLLGK